MFIFFGESIKIDAKIRPGRDTFKEPPGPRLWRRRMRGILCISDKQTYRERERSSAAIKSLVQLGRTGCNFFFKYLRS
jgi:hypothetical protein